MEIKLFNNPKFPCTEKYTEIGQENPIRWQLYSYSEEDQGYYPIFKEMKCKDYLNDVAYLYMMPNSKHIKTSHLQYGFPVAKPPYEEMRKAGGLYILITNLHKDFFSNWVTYLEPWIEKHGGQPVEFVDYDDKQAMLFIPEAYLKSTAYISILTQYIRFINCKLNDGASQNSKCPDYYSDIDCGRITIEQFTNFEGFNNKDLEQQICFCTYNYGDSTGQFPETMFDYQAFASIHNCGYQTAYTMLNLYRTRKAQSAL